VSLISGFEDVVKENQPLAPYTRLKLGGVAAYFAQPQTREQLVGLVQRFTENELPIRLIGAGSNTLIRNQGVGGLVISLSSPAFCNIDISGDTITAGGGVRLVDFVATAVREGLNGPQHLVGIPGTIGGALHNNTSAVGFDIGTWVQSVDVLTRSGEEITYQKEELSFSYRHSSLKDLILLSATFAFDREDSETLTKQMQKLWIVRRADQPPAEVRSAYVFKDHGGETASDLIDQAGLKGTRVGGVEICDRDPNYFIANDDATAEDFLKLVELVKTQVHDQLEINLETSVGIW
jgi:UDP-N-acetylmuramate dehydrogenase